MKKVLSLAGSDCSGGAGIQADIKTITAHKMYAMSVITALTAQNTLGVQGVLDINSQFVADQLEAIFTDIYPDAIKIGMVSNEGNIEVIMEKLQKYKVKNIVLDPVMISTSGSKLLKEEAIHKLITGLMPLATVITPNLMEAECLCGLSITSKEDMVRAAKEIALQYNGAILIKGGHLKDCSDDLLYDKGEYYWFEQEHIDNTNTHGTGCTLSSAIACHLADGKDMKSSVAAAKQYITGALSSYLDLGNGSGPLNHGWNFR